MVFLSTIRQFKLKNTYILSCRHRNLIFSSNFSTSDVFTVFGSSNLSQTGHQVPNCQALASSQSILEDLALWNVYNPSSYVRWALEFLHNSLEIDWWITIIACSCLARLVTYIMGWWKCYKLLKEPDVVSQYKSIIEEAKELKALSTTLGSKIFAYRNPTFLKEGPSLPAKWVQFNSLVGAFCFFTNFFALKGMVDAEFPGFSTEGTLWFKNLLALDPTYILPVLTACLFVAHRRADVLSSRDEKIYEFVSKTNYLSFSKKELEELAPKPDVPKQFYKSIIIPFCLISAVCMNMPSAICLYWATGHTITLCSMIIQLTPIGSRIDPLAKLYQTNKLSDGCSEKERNRLGKFAQPWQLRKS